MTIRGALKIIGTASPEIASTADVYPIWGARHAHDKTFQKKLICESLGFVKNCLAYAHYGDAHLLDYMGVDASADHPESFADSCWSLVEIESAAERAATIAG